MAFRDACRTAGVGLGGFACRGGLACFVAREAVPSLEPGRAAPGLAHLRVVWGAESVRVVETGRQPGRGIAEVLVVPQSSS